MEEEKDFKKGQKAYLKQVVNLFKEDATEALASIEKLKEKFIKGKEGEPSLIEMIKSTEKELDEIKTNIQTINASIFDEDENGAILADDIDDFKNIFEKRKNEIISIQNDIVGYRNKLLGIKNEDGSEIKGVTDQVDEFVDKLNDLYAINSNKQAELFNKIEGLLKGASAVALAKAFEEHKKSFNFSNILWISVFIFSVLSMMGLSIWAYKDSNHDLSELWKHTLGNLPFIVGAVWLAIFSSRQRSQNVRLQQEYAYKEDVAKIYYGLKKEINELGDIELGQKLNDQILSVIIETVSYNPSKTLESKIHRDKGPILESLNSLAEMIKDLKK